MSKSKTEALIEKEIVAELGERRAKGLKANAPSRVCGILTRNGSDWDEAYEHISDHFKSIAGKPSHTIFLQKYRNKEAVRTLIMRASSGPSRVTFAKLTIDGDPRGKPAVEIQRHFGEPIGDDPALTLLRIFIDFQGKLITAYPGKP